MESSSEIKKMVREKYSEIVLKKKNSCGCCSDKTISDYSVFADDYTNLEGYHPEADLQLGCGIPTEYAGIKEGDRVVDLGSGAGNDCFVARALAGEKGEITGVDFTEAMVNKARSNADKLGFQNVRFLLGEIEKIPLPDHYADVVISNCVMNLVPDKLKAYQETFRITKPGGHISISDIVLSGILPDSLKQEATLYAGCVSGAVQESEYLDLLKVAGFSHVQILRKKPIDLPSGLLLKYLDLSEAEKFKKGDIGIFSITIYAEK